MRGIMPGSTCRNFLFSKAVPYTRTMYIQRRMHSILANISMYKPEVVLMYGMDNINFA